MSGEAAGRPRDREWMGQALALAREAASDGETPVGAVVVWEDKIIGRGRNRREAGKSALAHAEIEAIAEACQNIGGWRLCDCDIYVTLEPCPMCAGAIINARIRRVIFGAFDPKAGSCGSVVDLFGLAYNHRPLLTGGILSDECGEVLRSFFQELRQKKIKDQEV